MENLRDVVIPIPPLFLIKQSMRMISIWGVLSMAGALCSAVDRDDFYPEADCSMRVSHPSYDVDWIPSEDHHHVRRATVVVPKPWSILCVKNICKPASFLCVALSVYAFLDVMALWLEVRRCSSVDIESKDSYAFAVSTVKLSMPYVWFAMAAILLHVQNNKK